jgi:hypothetical protein
MRLLSHSETQTALDCFAKHAFRYSGHLTDGDALKPRASAPRLREGTAWGAAVAAWHANAGIGPMPAFVPAVKALEESLAKDAAEQKAAGVYMAEEHAEFSARLGSLLVHYTDTAEQLPIDRLEGQLLVGIPSRNGGRKSTRYRLEAYVDGVHVDDAGRTWIVEFKLRGRLSSLEQIARSRQTRWYAWAYREIHGVEPAGVIVDERLNEIPKPARILKSGKASYAKDQITTSDLYREACEATGETPAPETVEALDSRQWSQRHPIIFRKGELDEAGDQLVSAARLIQGLDSGDLYPIRNPSPQRCGMCAFREICDSPDGDLVDAYFRRVAPKRLRSDKEEAVPA